MNTIKDNLITTIEDYNKGIINADELDSIINTANLDRGDDVFLVSYDVRGRAVLHHYLK